MPLQFTTIVVMILFAYMFALMNAGLISARIAEARLVQHQSRLALRNGANRYTDILRDFVRVHGTQVRWPTNETVSGHPFPVCSALTPAGSCSHSYTYRAHLTTSSDPSVAPNNVALNEMQLVAGESRVSAHITVTVLG
ncbi:MAG TPA: hypothetical protein VGZ00_07855, partial [Candidatus Baltobacteraceae bacterium]|nr:hypothetical protein [Candidatus Baltobacteraceae bacterium]